MINLLERTSVKAPTTYQEWLDCLVVLKGTNVYSTGVYDALVAGSFTGTDVTKAALQRQIVDSINAMLDNSAKRFIRNMNDSITFNELSQIELLFNRLKKDVKVALFFEPLEFLPTEFRNELSSSVRKQMSDFWNDTVHFLYEQSLEYSNSDLEDALFLIKRIKLFE